MQRLLVYLFLYMGIIACKQQTINSHSSDASLGGSLCASTLSESETRFCESKNIIASRCVSCHTGYHEGYANLTEADFIQQSLITVGDAANSSIFSILQNNGGTMPKGGKALPTEEITTLTDWIENTI